ncbi:MAG: hypothetical protein ACPGSI_17455 [Pikeienuella sp.]
MSIGAPQFRTEQSTRTQLQAAKIIAPTSLLSTEQTLYTAGEGDFWVVHFWAANVSGGSESLTLHIVPSGGSTSAANAVLWGASIAVGSVLVVGSMVNHRLAPGESLVAKCAVDNAVTVGGWGYDQFGEYA